MASGSIFVARRAGKYKAASATHPNSSVTPSNVTGSDGLTAYTKLAKALLSANTLKIPSANPARTGLLPSTITIRNTWPGSAHIAMRTPISCPR